MTCTVGQEYTRAFPSDWLRRLREVSPVVEAHSYLHPRWYAHRWVLYEMVPLWAIEDPGLVSALRGPHPDTLPEAERVALGQAGCSVYQYETFQATGRYARPSWILQGSHGGHAAAYDRPTKELLKATQRPTEPPAVGDLPYAPFDERVVRQLIKMDRLKQAQNDLSAFKRQATTEGQRRALREAMRAARAEYLAFLDEQVEEAAELFVSAYRKGEFEGAPVSARDWVQTDEEANHAFIETGSLTATLD